MVVRRSSRDRDRSRRHDVELHRERDQDLRRIEGDETDRARQAVGRGEMDRVAQPQWLVAHQPRRAVEAGLIGGHDREAIPGESNLVLEICA